MSKKIICILLSLTLLCLNISAVEWFNYDVESEKTTFIVEVEGDPLIFRSNATFYTESAMEQHSHSIMSAITEDVAPDSEIGYVYTKLFNGFSVETDSNKLEEISAIPGVKNVYIASTKYLPEPMMTSAGELTGTSYSYDLGYDGEGTVIAILDAGCDTSHPFFASAPNNPKYSSSDIDNFIANKTLHSEVSSANEVYRNEKIPYAYNYFKGNTNVYYPSQAHGTHVAGIAAGKNGTAPDGSTFSGVAPEAQLLIMTCGTEEGRFPEAGVLAAIEDAYTLGADVINMSFGSDYADSSVETAYNQMIENAKAAGVIIASAAGNASRGFKSKTPDVLNPDYSSAGTPNGFPAATSVASADNTAYSSAGQVSSFSAWGIDSTLELKPEITAPGRNIYSSVPGGGYQSASGTSMASPHMAGIYALASEYYKSNPFISAYNNLTGATRVELIENLAMNSADVILQSDGTPFSPRVQGAGLVNMENLINSHVILIGNSGKAKLSLGDNLDTNISLKFDITNISNTPVTFNDISFDVLTDGYTPEGKVNSSVRIPFTVASAPSSVTIASGDTYSFEAVVALDETFITNNAKVFANGFFIDGFVTLRGEDELYSSLPFTGFFGDFAAAPIFDTTIYDEGGSTLIAPDDTGVPGTFLAMTSGNNYLPLGMNSFDKNIVEEEYIAYSPKKGYGFRFIGRNLRSSSHFSFSIVNSSDRTVLGVNVPVFMNKFKTYYYDFTASELTMLAEGKYTFRVGGTFVGESNTTDTIEIPFVVDNTTPEVIGASYDATNKTVTIRAKDNHFLSGIQVGYITVSDETNVVKVAIDNNTDISNGIVTKTIPISDVADPTKIQIACVDYASNMTVVPLALYSDTIGVNLVGLNQLESVTQAKFNVRNNSASPVNAKLVAAFYDGSDKLLGTSSLTRTLSSGVSTPVTYGFVADTRQAEYAKLFIWTPLSMIPIDSAKTFDLN